jgi:hypothetical protein
MSSIELRRFQSPIWALNSMGLFGKQKVNFIIRDKIAYTIKAWIQIIWSHSITLPMGGYYNCTV